MVKWSEPAKQDLRQIHDFIARDSERYAKKVTMDFVTRSEVLQQFPEMGRMIPNLMTQTSENYLSTPIA